MTLSNSTDQRVCYGQRVALQQEGTGAFLVVDRDTGDIRVMMPDERWEQRGVPPFRDVIVGRGGVRTGLADADEEPLVAPSNPGESPEAAAAAARAVARQADAKARTVRAPIFTFRLCDLAHPRRTAEVRHGEPLWLVAMAGRGEDDWKAGSVIGSHVHRPVELSSAAAKALRPDQLKALVDTRGAIVGSVRGRNGATSFLGGAVSSMRDTVAASLRDGIASPGRRGNGGAGGSGGVGLATLGSPPRHAAKNLTAPGLPQPLLDAQTLARLRNQQSGVSVAEIIGEDLVPNSSTASGDERAFLSLTRRAAERTARLAALPSMVLAEPVPWPTLSSEALGTAAQPASALEAARGANTIPHDPPAGLGRDVLRRVGDQVGVPRPVPAHVPASKAHAYLLGPATTGNSSGVYFDGDPGYEVLYDTANKAPLVLGSWRAMPALKAQLPDGSVMGALGAERRRGAHTDVGATSPEGPPRPRSGRVKTPMMDSIATTLAMTTTSLDPDSDHEEDAYKRPATAGGVGATKARPSSAGKRPDESPAEGSIIMNGARIYLEQDWFYISAAARGSGISLARSDDPAIASTIANVVEDEAQAREDARRSRAAASTAEGREGRPQPRTSRAPTRVSVAAASINKRAESSRPAVLEQLQGELVGPWRVDRRGIFTIKVVVGNELDEEADDSPEAQAAASAAAAAAATAAAAAGGSPLVTKRSRNGSLSGRAARKHTRPGVTGAKAATRKGAAVSKRRLSSDDQDAAVASAPAAAAGAQAEPEAPALSATAALLRRMQAREEAQRAGTPATVHPPSGGLTSRSRAKRPNFDSAKAAREALERQRRIEQRGRSQIADSRRQRLGLAPSKQYSKVLVGGESFAVGLRHERMKFEDTIDSSFLEHEAEKLRQAVASGRPSALETELTRRIAPKSPGSATSAQWSPGETSTNAALAEASASIRRGDSSKYPAATASKPATPRPEDFYKLEWDEDEDDNGGRPGTGGSVASVSWLDRSSRMEQSGRAGRAARQSARGPSSGGSGLALGRASVDSLGHSRTSPEAARGDGDTEAASTPDGTVARSICGSEAADTMSGAADRSGDFHGPWSSPQRRSGSINWQRTSSRIRPDLPVRLPSKPLWSRLDSEASDVSDRIYREDTAERSNAERAAAQISRESTAAARRAAESSAKDSNHEHDAASPARSQELASIAECQEATIRRFIGTSLPQDNAPISQDGAALPTGLADEGEHTGAPELVTARTGTTAGLADVGTFRGTTGRTTDRTGLGDAPWDTMGSGRLTADVPASGEGLSALQRHLAAVKAGAAPMGQSPTIFALGAETSCPLQPAQAERANTSDSGGGARAGHPDLSRLMLIGELSALARGGPEAAGAGGDVISDAMAGRPILGERLIVDGEVLTRTAAGELTEKLLMARIEALGAQGSRGSGAGQGLGLTEPPDGASLRGWAGQHGRSPASADTPMGAGVGAGHKRDASFDPDADAAEELAMTAEALGALDRQAEALPNVPNAQLVARASFSGKPGSTGWPGATTEEPSAKPPQKKVRSTERAKRTRRLSWTASVDDGAAEALTRAGAKAGDPSFDSIVDPATGRRGKPGSAFTFAAANHFASVLAKEDSTMRDVARLELTGTKGSDIVRELLSRKEVYQLPVGIRPKEITAGVDPASVHSTFATSYDSESTLRAQLAFGRSFHRLSAKSSLSRIESAARMLRSGELVPGSGLLGSLAATPEADADADGESTPVAAPAASSERRDT